MGKILNNKYQLIVLITVMYLPLLLSIERPANYGSMRELASYFSATTGYLGAIMLLMSIILSSRAVVGVFSSDLSKINKWHQWIGKYGLLLILIHPLLISYYFGKRGLEYITYIVVPNFETTRGVQIGYGRSALMFLLIIWITSAVIRAKIKYRPWKYIHYLSYLILPGVFVHPVDIGYNYMNSQLINVYWKFLALIFIVLLVLRIRYLFGFGKKVYQVQAHQEINPNVHQLVLQPVGSPLKKMQHSKFVYISKKLLGEEHPFSISYYDQATGNFMITYKVFGKFTHHLADIKIGDKIYVDGPYGHFTLEPAISYHEPTVIISGGIGITPFYQHILNLPADHKLTLIYCNQTQATSVYLDQFRKILRDKLVEIYNQESNNLVANKPNMYVGYISKDIVLKYSPYLPSTKYYICGPPAMMKSVQKILQELEVKPENIYSENFSF